MSGLVISVKPKAKVYIKILEMGKSTENGLMGFKFEKKFEKRGIKKSWVLELLGSDLCRYTCVEEPEHTTGIVHVSKLTIELKCAIRRWFPEVSTNTLKGLSLRMIHPCMSEQFQELVKSVKVEPVKRKAPSTTPLPIKIARLVTKREEDECARILASLSS